VPQRLIVLTFDDIRLTPEAVLGLEYGIKYWGRLISVFVTNRWKFRKRKLSEATVSGLRTIFSVPCERGRFGVSRIKELNGSRIPLPICPHCGAGGGGSVPQLDGDFALALLPQTTTPCQRSPDKVCLVTMQARAAS
jgi:hypothetical protein